MQERQDAMYQMTGATGEKVDVILVVGGFNSSNTSHLQEIGELAGITTFWIDSAERINVEEKSITWQDSHHNLSTTTNFLPEGNIVLGVTSGASTPDKAVELCLERIFEIKVERFCSSTQTLRPITEAPLIHKPTSCWDSFVGPRTIYFCNSHPCNHPGL